MRSSMLLTRTPSPSRLLLTDVHPAFLSVSLSVSLSLCLSVCLSVSPSLSLSVSLYRCVRHCMCVETHILSYM